jgi:DNA-binding LacI/PurR family transcriptional regulator
MSKAQTTIKDIARKLRISVSTVSRALRNLPDVNPETKKAVQELAKELNYEPNYVAQSLINKKTRIIGVIVPVIGSQVFGRILTGMNDSAQQHNYQLMICQSNENAELEANLIRQLASFKIDGLLISVSGQTKDEQCFDILKKKEVPMVLLDRVISNMDVTKIVVDGYHSSFMAVEHLIKSGCRSIAHLSGPRHLSISIGRLNGYLEALKKHGIPVNEKLIVPCENFEKDAPSAARKLFSAKPYPDGIFAINDLSAVTVIQFLRKKGIRVPEEVAVVGFNDDPICEIIEPALTTVRLPCYEIGQRAVEMLVARINDHTIATETVTLKSKLIIRNSSVLSKVKSNKPFAFSV